MATGAAGVVVITSRTQYEILRLFAEGKTEQEIADYTTLELRAVTRVVNEMCAGDRPKAAELVAAYELRARAVAAAQGKPGVPGVPRTTTVPPAGTLRQPDRPAAPDVLAQMLAAAKASPHQRTRTLGERLAALAAELRGRLADEKRAAEEAEAAARARAEAQKRVDELAAKLAEARAALRAVSGSTAAPARPAAQKSAATPAKQVRAWAAEQGIDCPARGRIPDAVMTAYREHHAKEQ